MQWHQAVDQLSPYVVRIATPQRSGTGWLVSRSTTSDLCGIATAAHVIDHAHYWEEPVRLFHPRSGRSVVLRPADRAVHIEAGLDSAAIVFPVEDLPLPAIVPALVDKEQFIKPGVEIGWLGFPAIPSAELCFFSGRISAYLQQQSAYLVDGVAINGVSGGPAFTCGKDSASVLGIVSAYIPNRATGDILPGVSVVREAMQFHDLAQRFRSFDEAKQQESPPSEPSPSPEAPAADGSVKTEKSASGPTRG